MTEETPPTVEIQPDAPAKKKRSCLKVGCGVGCVFSLGIIFGLIAAVIIIGSVVKNAENWKTAESRKFITDHLANQLKLDDDQLEKFRPIVQAMLDERWELRKNYLTESQRLMWEKYYPQVEEFLTEEQKAKADEMMEKWRKDHRPRIEEDAPQNSDS